MKLFISIFCLSLWLINNTNAQQNIPEIIANPNVEEKYYLPDFSYAGYHFGEKEISTGYDHIIDVSEFGARPNDQIDDSEAFIRAIDKANELKGIVLVNIPPGRFDLSQIIYISRSNTVIRGAGKGTGGTILHFQRPLSYVPDPPELAELREYLVSLDKRQREPENGVDILFSQYSWSGGYFWVGKKDVRFKPYLPSYNKSLEILANSRSGKQGTHKIVVSNASKINTGGFYQLNWYNKDGKDGSLLRHIYHNYDVEIGSHHWTSPDSPLINQKVKVTKVNGDTVFIKDPLLHDVKSDWYCNISEWGYITEVGIENIAFEFPAYPDMPHHVENGSNGIYLTNLMNGWVRNVSFKNADSGILTDNISNVTIEDIRTYGKKRAHYSVAMGEVHNVLVRNLKVENLVMHPLSFNTRSTKCVYTNCEVERQPILDQHSGANEQNLFDNIKVFIDAPVHQNYQYPLFLSGGAGYWAPAHGAFSTFYNIDIEFANLPPNPKKPILLDGVKEGVSARLIGVHANHPVTIEYGPNAYIEKPNQELSIKSLYHYQLQKRATNGGFEAFLLLEEDLLLKTKQGIKAGNIHLIPAYDKLIKEAEVDYLKPLPSVTHKKFIPPSGDKHDYMSVGPYWWPDPDSPDGLPYIVKDGQVNPERYEYDRTPLSNLIAQVRNLSLAYYFSEDEKYAARTIELLETWFLNPETKMNPNLKYAQAIKGRVTGRGIGIIDTRRFAYIPDAIRLIQNSKSYSPQFEEKMKSWFSEFLDWLWNHQYGQDERNWSNNHGTSYDLQVTTLALFTGNIELAKMVLNDVPYRRICSQIEPDGKQPLELRRTRSYNYTVGNLGHFVNLAILGNKVGIDIFNYAGSEGQSIKQAVDFLKPYIKGNKKWDYEQITSIEANQINLYKILNTLAYYYDDCQYSKLGSMLKPELNNTFLSNLLYPSVEVLGI